MSFSTRVKEELAAHISSSRHCRIAELSAMLLMTGYYDKDAIKEDAFDKLVYKKCEKLIYMVGIDAGSEDGMKTLKITSTENGCDIDKMLIERSCCKQAFLRGAFLAAGSITNPEKGYHFEIVCDTEKQASIIESIMTFFELEPKLVIRKKYHVVYMKDGTKIVDALNIMGAHISLMEMENVRILKDMRNSVNRRVNCEAANMNKTVNAAVKQAEDIRFIEETMGINFLPENLREIALLRLEEPEETSLKELGEMLHPPIGKSGVNHRLRKISEIANELRRKKK